MFSYSYFYYSHINDSLKIARPESPNDINGDWGTKPDVSGGIMKAIFDKADEMHDNAKANCKGKK